jgi:sialate O-acetylesterase
VGLPESPEINQLEIADVWIGEVWLASGQSNMEWTLEQCGEAGQQAAAMSRDPLLRMFTVEKRAELAPQRDVAGAWCVAEPGDTEKFSAVAYHFARRLRSELDSAVGVIVSAWGGTPIEAWMPRHVHVGSPLLREKLRQYEDHAYSDKPWKSAAEMGKPAFPSDPGTFGSLTASVGEDVDDAGWPVMHLPTTWQLSGHGHSGVFWFRKRVTIPDAWIGCDLRLELGAVDKQDITFVNGVEVGRTGQDFEMGYWNQARDYKVPASIVTGNELVIAVRVYSFVFDGGMIGPEEGMRLSCSGFGQEALALGGEWRYRIEHDLGYVPNEGVLGHLSQGSPHILYDNMIAPLVPYSVRGILWYQGESNAGRAMDYPVHLRGMIAAWREAWELGELPFLIVQLPGYGLEAEYTAASSWALMRQGQLDLVRDLPGLGIAVTIDCGEADEIHPQNKEPVGQRLAQWALSETYGKSVLQSGPLVRDARLHEGGRVRVDFESCGSGLATSNGLPVGGVFLLDSAGAVHRSEVQMESNGIWVHSAACLQPVAVVYGWADFPLEANLINGVGLPASPFKQAVVA